MEVKIRKLVASVHNAKTKVAKFQFEPENHRVRVEFTTFNSTRGKRIV